MTIFSAISDIARTVYKKNKFEIPENDKVKFVSEYFNCTPVEAAMLSYFIYRKIDDEIGWFDISDVNRDLDITMTETLSYIPVVESLLKKNIFCLRGNIRYDSKNFSFGRYDCFDIDENLIDIITYNLPFSEYKPDFSNKVFNAIDFISSIKSLPDKTILSKYAFKRFISPYMKDKWVRQFLIDMGASKSKSVGIWDNSYTYLKYFLLFASLLWQEAKCSVKEALASKGEIPACDVIHAINEIKDGTAPYIKHGYLEVDKTDIADNIQVMWGPKVKDVFKGAEDLLIQDRSSKELQKILVKDIKEKTLFYNEENQKDISRLESIIKEENYFALRKRLSDRNLAKGLTIILYGPPGTGKTETVMQLARQTGRDIYYLNIEQVKSCFVGESEKNIKSIFKAYYASKSKLKPILLFNEADAILSKRTSVEGRNSAVTKMENSMQNILLEELEKFDGIFVATTNILFNLDSAFDRRFLYKLELQNPTYEVKKKIWKNKIPSLDDSIVEKVSRDFDFSGGQIDNVYRKIEVDSILYGTENITMDDVVDFCNKEKFADDSLRRIGFQQS